MLETITLQNQDTPKAPPTLLTLPAVQAMTDATLERANSYADAAAAMQREWLTKSFTSHATAMTERLDEALANVEKRCTWVKVGDMAPVEFKDGMHPQTTQVLQYMVGMKKAGLGEGVWLYGPAGTGKSEIFRQAAEALNLPYASLSCTGETTKGEFVGRFNHATGTWDFPLFVKTYRYGGVISLEEIGMCPSDTLGVILSALAQKIIFLGNGEKVEMHKDCYIVATDNTAGTGATSSMTGRTRQDAATLDRFMRLFVGYSETVDAACCPHKGLRVYLQGIREKLDSLKCRDESLTSRSMRRAHLHMSLGMDSNGCVALLTPGWSPTVISQSGISPADIQSAWERV